ncbi:restriction endonuclease subunit S [Bradyrhizobium sp. CCGUVB4N]|uniref:restriction endonuclease subunit S n=1 Tax=Bradyrhizobium sp. CCGUVB4N TaxID=2949631 RepID=UPI0020B3FB73|nr:restriction endonuclease subunit S [Bradyrhizobium sp. CCGUVB4N]MCP3381215.1 restriction endonuclease subunit S [Bradyrhizobium sp. CCGUVB4N]
MINVWPLRAMGEICHLERRQIFLMPDASYREVGIRSFGRGVFHKAPTTGLEIGGKRVFSIEPGDLLFNIVFAWEGAVAVASQAEKGMIGSHRFLTYVMDGELADARYLYWWFCGIEGRKQLLKASPGGAGRNRTLGIDKLAAVRVPLPPLDEQRRIVAHVDDLVAKVAEARSQRELASTATRALVPSLLHDIFVLGSKNWQAVAMDRVVAINDRQVDPVLPAYSNLPHINGENIEAATGRLLAYRTAAEDGVRSNKYLFSPGTILYSKIRPYLRKAATVNFSGVCSADMYPLRIINEDILPAFVKWALLADPFTAYANKLSGRTRMPKLNRNQLFAFNFAFPPLSEQQRIVDALDALQARVDVLKELQAGTTLELDALIPSVLHATFQDSL